MSSTNEELRSQWYRPSDIFSLLLLIYGDVVQESIAQLVGHKISLPGNTTMSIPIAPVAFSFGWVTYAFSNVCKVIKGKSLMPLSDYPAILVNCENGNPREAKAWILGHLLRDYEIRCNKEARSRQKDNRAESLRVDIFQLGPASKPTCDFVWWFGWVTILTQVGIASVPWILYNDWGIMLVTLCGNLLVAVTVGLPQWVPEKWPTRVLQRDKITCLTRGNGHRHIMVLIASRGSWDLEAFATGETLHRSETGWIYLALAVLWICLLINASGLRQNSWFLIAIGGIGMLQNTFAANACREASAFNFHLSSSPREPTIIGEPTVYTDDIDAVVNLQESLEELNDISKWVSNRRLIISHIADATSTVAFQMPQWLHTMSKDDGVPSWLEPVKPDHVHEGMESAQISSDFSPGVQRPHNLDTKHRKDVVFVGGGVHGALMELEKWVPTAGLAMVQIFFPAGLKYNDESIRDNIHKKFWQRAHFTRSARREADGERRAEARNLQFSYGI